MRTIIGDKIIAAIYQVYAELHDFSMQTRKTINDLSTALIERYQIPEKEQENIEVLIRDLLCVTDEEMFGEGFRTGAQTRL